MLNALLRWKAFNISFYILWHDLKIQFYNELQIIVIVTRINKTLSLIDKTK